ncbi:sigma factor-like helix-turn-helix DNA-binding protein [Pelomonas sp. Root1217]|uniref:sigma factor-like helix-turn-helix DNA-binding protein n=1 Tax=Pelomonas sp. Root1217 TaxID=1736430 RepID=UPI00070F813A|nr:sigma factor-like helix-turn-helix DNA-binding protein [Pelomonas sp. Root1217]
MTTPPVRSIIAESDEEEAGDDIAGEEPAAPDATYAHREQMQIQSQLVHFVERLPASERRVVFTHYFQLHTFEEIALDMDLTKGRVSQLHHAALRRMREWGSSKDLPQPD